MLDKVVYSKEQLYHRGEQKKYNDHCTEAAFLLGGIGTGNVSVGVRGNLKDWEIFGKSGKGNYMPNQFFAIWIKEDGKAPRAKVLESKIKPPYPGSHGYQAHEIGGLPRFERSSARGEYPYFWVDLEDASMPVKVTMESFTPFIPLNADDSGIPIAIIRYRVINETDAPIAVSVVGSISNLTSLKEYDRYTWQSFQVEDEGVNEYKDDSVIRGLYFHPKTLTNTSMYYGTLSLTTTSKNVSYKRSWLRGGWWDGLQDMWDDFREDGILETESYYVQKDTKYQAPEQNGSLSIHQTIEPYEEKVFEFQLSWSFPNRVNCWSTRLYDEAVRGTEEQEIVVSCCGSASDCSTSASRTTEDKSEYPVIRKYYSKAFPTAWHAARYTVDNLERLEKYTRAFHDALFQSTLPDYVIETIANNITILRSNTCFRLEDGTLMAWEGCFGEEGCCEGTCTHVWNYAQTIAFLFPELEQSMRRVEYMIETEEDGKMNFRSYKMWGMGGHDHVPAADGQMGTLVRLYREWKFSGDNDFLRKMWPKAKATMDFALDYWDKDGDFVLDTNQFNTYDISFQGPSSMINSIFYAALKAGAEMAKFMGDEEGALRYENVFKMGSKRMDEMLWGGKYYVQAIENVDEYKYQYGKGCLSDQIFGQTMAHVAGLGYVLPEEHVKQAVKSIFDNNFLISALEHHNTQRTYLLNDEKGLLLCTWNNAIRPKLPFPYSDEVWPGIEYQVATNLIYEGYVDEALTIVKAVRDRHDGVGRNPWNEVECGHHYARSLASYGLLVALSGFFYDLPKGRISFSPKINEDDFRCFFSTGKCWGVYIRKKQEDGTVKEKVDVLYGDMSGIVLNG